MSKEYTFMKKIKKFVYNKKFLTLLFIIILFLGVINFISYINKAKNGRFIKTREASVRIQNGVPTLLKDGRVLITGGCVYVRSRPGKAGGCKTTDNAEIYDPKTGKFSLVGNMNFPHINYTATLLNNGKVLIVGGEKFERIIHNNVEINYGKWMQGAEIYDHRTGKFIPTGNTKFPREYHTATLLKDGRVLIVGGLIFKGKQGGIKDAIKSEIYDPYTGEFTLTGKLNYAREDHTATLLQDGRVLITGGYELKSAEIYNPKTRKFIPAGNMNVVRRHHFSFLLPNGNVLIIGGINDSWSKSLGWAQKRGRYDFTNIEEYNPKTQKFKIVAKLIKNRVAPECTLLKNGKILVTGGDHIRSDYLGAEIYDPVTRKSILTNSFNDYRRDDQKILLKDGRLLFLGIGRSSIFVFKHQ